MDQLEAFDNADPTTAPPALGLGALFTALPEAVLAADAVTGAIVAANPATERLLGYAPAELIGRLLTSLLPAEVTPDGLAEASADGPVRLPVMPNNRPAREFAVSVHRQADPPLHLAVLRETEPAGAGRVPAPTADAEGRFLRGVLNNLPAGLAFYGPDLRVRLANDEYVRLFNRTLDDVIGKHVLEIFGQPGRVLEDIILRIFRTGEAIDSFNLAGTYHFDGKTYEGVWDVTRKPIFGPDGKVEGVVVLMQDVSERAELNRELQRRTGELAEQRALTERIVQHAPVMMTFLDRNLIYRWNNPVHSRFIGQPPERVIGRSVFELLPARTLERTLNIYREVLDTGEPRHATSVPSLEVDPPSYWDIDYVPMFEDGGVAGILVLAVDVTPRVEADRLQAEQIAHLRQVDSLKDQFLSILSHELRTPLNAILGFASILDDELAGSLNGDQHHFLDKILGGTEVLLALINDLLDMSRIQAGKFSLQPEPMNVAEVVNRAVGHLSALAEQKGHTLHTELPEDLPAIVADPQRVEQVVLNLVGNAIKFTPEGGTIRVQADRRGPEIRVAVTDNGIGIAEEDQSRLFQPFTQVDGSNTRAAGGTGLGLSISKALVEAHGGRIGVESRPDCGSTFWFTLKLNP